MKTIEAYQASDGKIFGDRSRCIDYENTIDPMFALLNHIETNCTASYNDDAGFSIIENTDVAAYIIKHFLEIEKLYKNCAT